MSKRESDGSIKNAAHNNAIGDGMTGDTVVGDNQTGDKPESQESLLKIFTGNGSKILVLGHSCPIFHIKIFGTISKTLKVVFRIMKATGSSNT